MAQPLRFRYSTERWDTDRVQTKIFTSLDRNLGATASRPWFALHAPYSARRFDMDNGDTALFAWGETDAYWLGNTETPRALWRTDKVGFGEAPNAITTWAERELLAELHDTEPWLAQYPHLSRFFLPVLCSKDGRESSRAFFRAHAAGFPDSDRDAALSFYDQFLATGVLDPYRHEMAGKLGTSPTVDVTRMAAAMSEFTVARLLSDAGFDVVPEIEVTTGHSIDFKAARNGDAWLVEVTRPGRPRTRRADTAVAAIRDTVSTKTAGQLDDHGGGVTLFVDCSSFSDAEWDRVTDATPAIGHRPAVVFRARPTGDLTGYRLGRVPLELGSTIEWVG